MTDQTFYDVAMAEADSFRAAGYFTDKPQPNVKESARMQLAEAWANQDFYDSTMAELGVLSPPANSANQAIPSTIYHRLNQQFWSRVSFLKATAREQFSFQNLLPYKLRARSETLAKAIDVGYFVVGTFYAILALATFYSASLIFISFAYFLVGFQSVISTITNMKRRP